MGLNHVFFEEWASFLEIERYTEVPEEIILMGDVNFHLNTVNDTVANKFKSSFDAFGLVQHIKDPTHYLGNLLDVVITKQESKFVHSTPDVFDPGFCNLKGKPLKDHSAVMFTVNVYQLQIQSRNVSSEN